MVRECTLLRDLASFVRYLDNGTDPRVLTFRKESFSVPMTDYSEQIADSQTRGYTLAMAEGQALLEAERIAAPGTPEAYSESIRRVQRTKHDPRIRGNR